MRPISQRRLKTSGLGCLIPFFGLFFAIGAAVFYLTSVRPALLLLAARSWMETSCVVVSSRVEESSSSDGSTYKPDILYSYTVNGVEYQSRRYNAMEGSSSGYEGKAEIVARYPPGSRTVCYVNPEDPRQALLTRGLSPGFLVGLVPLLFMAVGGGGIFWVLRAKAKRAAAVPAGTASLDSPFGVAVPPGAHEPRELRPQWSRTGKLIGLILVSLFWNGIVSVFVWQAWRLWREGQPNGCMTLFLIPFVVIGLLLIAGVFQQLLILFNPRLKLTLSQGVLVPGQPVLMQWSLSGQAAGVRRLRITLEGREEATYRRGTNTHTDRETFATISVVNTDQSSLMPAGSAQIEVPAEAMPSFKADHNKIFWVLKAVSEIPGWPDTEDEYEVIVSPPLRRGGWS